MTRSQSEPFNELKSRSDLHQVCRYRMMVDKPVGDAVRTGPSKPFGFTLQSDSRGVLNENVSVLWGTCPPPEPQVSPLSGDAAHLFGSINGRNVSG